MSLESELYFLLTNPTNLTGVLKNIKQTVLLYTWAAMLSQDRIIVNKKEIKIRLQIIINKTME